MSTDELHDEELQWLHDPDRRRSEGVTTRTLSLPVRLVPPKTPVVVGQEETVFEAILKMQENRIGAVLVETPEGLGIVTERDIIMKIPGKGRLSKDVQVKEIMTPDPVTLHPEDSIAFAMNYMAVGGYRHLPILDDAGCPVGILSVRDLLRFIVEFFPQEVISLPPKPQRGGMPRYGG
jgi:CBS domain-containing protein